MNTTATMTAAVIATPEAGPAKLLFTLVNDEVVELETRGWNVDILLESTFRRGFFKATDGVFYAAHLVKSIVAK